MVCEPGQSQLNLLSLGEKPDGVLCANAESLSEPETQSNLSLDRFYFSANWPGNINDQIVTHQEVQVSLDEFSS